MYSEIDSLGNTCFLGLSAQMVHTIRIKLKIDVLYVCFFHLINYKIGKTTFFSNNDTMKLGRWG